MGERMRINELDAVAFRLQELAREGRPVENRLPWLQAQWNLVDAAGLMAGFADLCDAIHRACTVAEQQVALQSLTFTRGDGKSRTVRWSERALDRVVEWWRAGDLHRVTVDVNSADMTAQAELGIDLPWAFRADRMTVVQIVVWSAPQIAPIAEQLLQLISERSLQTQPVYGAITYDFGQGRQLPWEMWYGRDRGWELADQIARGYYWANLLSQIHLDALGGLAQVVTDADHAGMETIVLREEPTRQLAWIRMPWLIDKVSDEHLAAMKTLLSPALPTVRYRHYRGHPLRVLKDPGDAYIVPAPGTKLTLFDRAGNPIPGTEWRG